MFVSGSLFISGTVFLRPGQLFVDGSVNMSNVVLSIDPFNYGSTVAINATGCVSIGNLTVSIDTADSIIDGTTIDLFGAPSTCPHIQPFVDIQSQPTDCTYVEANYVTAQLGDQSVGQLFFSVTELCASPIQSLIFALLLL